MVDDVRITVPEVVQLHVSQRSTRADKVRDWAPWLGLLGVIAAAAIGYYSTLTNAHKSKILDLQADAYTQFANAQADYRTQISYQTYLKEKLLYSRSEERKRITKKIGELDDKIVSSQFAISDASNRIAIYGDKEVVRSIANFNSYDENKPRCDDDKRKSDRAMYESVRKSILGNDVEPQTKADMAMIIFGCIVPGTAQTTAAASNPLPPASMTTGLPPPSTVGLPKTSSQP
jgi:hypothetical protein